LSDQVGNSDDYSSNFSVDYTPPNPPVVDPYLSVVTTNLITLTGSKEADTALWVDGVLAVSNNAATTWSADLSLTDGDNSFSLTLKDLAGNESEPPTLVNIRLDNTAPGPVTITAVVEGKGTEATLDWTSYDEVTNGNDIAEYRIYLSNNAFSDVTLLTPIDTVPAGAKGYHAVNLARGQTSYLAVVAVDVQDQFNPTVTPRAVLPVDIVEPDEITSLTVTPGSDNLQLQWLASTNSDGDLAGYRVYVTSGTQTTSSDILVASLGDITAPVLHSVTGLTAATSYPIRVTVFDADGNETTGLTDPGVTLLPNPTGLALVEHSNKLVLEWNAVAPWELLDHYAVYVSTSDFSDITGMMPNRTVAKGASSDTTIESSVAGLENNIVHYVAVTAVNISGGETTLVTTQSGTPQEDQTGPTITETRFNDWQQTLDFGAALTLVRNGKIEVAADDISGINRVDFYIDSELLGSDVTVSGGYYQQLVDLLSIDDGSHTLTVKVFDIWDNPTEQDYPFTVALAAPQAPVITQPASDYTTNQASVTIQGTAAVDTQVQLYQDGAAQGAPVEVNSQGDYSFVASLQEGGNVFTTAAEYPGRGGFSPTSTARTINLNSSIPNAPSGLEATAGIRGQVFISWSAVESVDPDNQIVGYNLYRSTTDFTSKDDAGVEAVNTELLTQTTLTDMPIPDGEYVYRVLTVNQFTTESALSTPAVVTADSQGPRVLSVEYVSQGNVDLATGRHAPGYIDITVRFDEPLRNDPYFALMPLGGLPLTVDLSKDYEDDTLYTGGVTIESITPSGLASAVMSAHDLVSNRGTDIDSGNTLLLDTQGPEVSAISINPGEPLQVDENNGLQVEVLITLNDDVKTGEMPLLIPKVDGVVIPEYASGILLSPDAQSVPGTPLWVGSFLLPNTAGLDGQGQPTSASLSFNYLALDDMDNQATKIYGQSQFQLYQGDLPPLDVPRNLAADPQPAGAVALSWDAVEEAVSYKLYRRLPGGVVFEQLVEISGTSHTDVTSSDGDYAYTVSSIRQENGQTSESAPSEPVIVSADRTAPSAPLGFNLELNGAGIVSRWTAPTLDSGGAAEDVPALRYTLYRLPLADGESADAALLAVTTPLQTGIPDIIALDSNPNESEHSYVVTAVDAAGNESAPSATEYENFGLLPVSDLDVHLANNGQPQLSWRHQGTAIDGYHVYRGEEGALTKLNSALIPHTGNPTSFIDSDYNGGVASQGASQQRRYTVVAVDSSELESIGHSIVLPALSVAVEQPEDDTEPLLRRGVMNEVIFNVSNGGDAAATGLTLKVSVDDDGVLRNHQSSTFSVDAGGITSVPVVIGGFGGLAALSDLQLRIEQQPQSGEEVSIGQSEEVLVGDAALLVSLELDSFVRGGAGLARFTLENISAVETEVILARSNGTAESNEVRLVLEDEDGNVLSQQAAQQYTGGVISVSGGYMVARIAPGASFTSDWISIAVPEAAPDTVTLRLEIDKFHYHTGRSTHVEIEGTGTRQDTSLQETPYTGSLTSVNPATTYGDDEPIVITGQAIDRVTGLPLADVPLRLVISVRGFERTSSVYTDTNGDFSYSYVTQGDSGLYQVSVIHPDSLTRPNQGQFVVQNAAVSPGTVNVRISRNYQQNIRVRVSAGYETSLSDVQLLPMAAPGQEYPQTPQGISLSYSDPIDLAARQSGYVSLNFSGDNAAPDDGTLYFKVVANAQVADEDALGTVVLSYELSEARPVITPSPRFIDTGVGLDTTVTESVTLTNTGLDVLTNASVRLTDGVGGAAPDWAFISSTTQLGDLAVGEQASVQLTLNPDANVAQGNYEVRLQVDSDNGVPFWVQFFVTLTTSVTGDAAFHISDIYTLTEDHGGQLIYGLAGAKIELQNEEVLTETFTRTSDVNGETLFDDLPVGRYTYRVSAFDHDSVTGRIWIKPDVTADEEVFLLNKLITVEWEVNEIPVEDRYEIILKATFETNVPVAVVMLDPLAVNLPVMEKGDIYQGELSLTNYGLIRAASVTASLPTGNEYISIEFLSEVPDTLEPAEVVYIPYRIQALKDFNPAEDGAASGGGCGQFNLYARVSYESQCINGAIVNNATSTTWHSAWGGSCGGSSSGGTSYYRGGGGYGGGGTSYSPGGGSWIGSEQICAPVTDCHDDCVTNDSGSGD
ncbi:MAG: hypothetical protein GY934_18125, partial [Gammaproteobacteria bacterium]|nr:hypothetical protein [Gammaproteobacteria bacterium]